MTKGCDVSDTTVCAHANNMKIVKIAGDDNLLNQAKRKRGSMYRWVNKLIDLSKRLN